jgi:hypothetical protein
VSSVLPVVRAAYGDLPKFKPGKKWVRHELTKNGKPVRQHMHIKSGDTIQVSRSREMPGASGGDRARAGRGHRQRQLQPAVADPG